MEVDIAIITIREDEFKAVRERFKTKRQRIPGGRTYLIGEVKTHEKQVYTIAIARCSDQGTDASQKLANYIIHNLDPQIILVVGIAGGVPHDDFTLGDVVVSTHIVNPNVDALNADGTVTYTTRGGPPHPLVEDITGLLPGDPQLTNWNEAALVQLNRPNLNPQQVIIQGDKEWRERVRKSLDWHFGRRQNRSRPPTFTIGSILSSNHLMKNPSMLIQMLKTNRSILAVEMEAAGVYEAAQRLDRSYPVMAIRGISDIIGLQRESQWTEYACQVAAAFTYAFVMATPIDPRMHSQEPQQVETPQARESGSSHEKLGSLQVVSQQSSSQENQRQTDKLPNHEKGQTAIIKAPGEVIISFDSLLMEERQKLGLTREEVAKHIGVTAYLVERWERGQTVPSSYVLKQLCSFFGKSAEELGFSRDRRDRVPNDAEWGPNKIDWRRNDSECDGGAEWGDTECA